MFLILLLIWDTFVLKGGLLTWLESIREHKNFGYTCLAILFIGVGLYIFFVLILHSVSGNRSVKIVGILLFSLIACIEYNYLKALGRFTSMFDFDAMLSATRQQTLDSISFYFGGLWLVPVAGLIYISLTLPDRSRSLSWRSFSGWILCSAVFYSQLFYSRPLLFEDGLSTTAFDAFSQTSVNYLISKRIGFVDPHPRETIQAIAERFERPQNNIVVIFDESVRGDHLSVNGYPRDTTPYLKRIAADGQLTNWFTASSTSTSSEMSFDFFIAGATPDLLEQNAFAVVNRFPSIFQYAKAMNYETYFVDGQVSDYWGGTRDDKNFIDHFVNTRELGNLFEKRSDQMIDTDISLYVHNLIWDSSGNFVFVYKRGNHFPYERNYPRSSAVWMPVFEFGEDWTSKTPSPKDLSGLVNSYDNGLLYNVDSFFKNLADDYSRLPNNTIIFYTSDHGEAFNTDGRSPHGGSSVEEATVPLFAFGLPVENIDISFKASHANLFTALLDLMNVPMDARKYPYAKSLLTATASDSQRRFFNLADGKKVAFDP